MLNPSARGNERCPVVAGAPRQEAALGPYLRGSVGARCGAMAVTGTTVRAGAAVAAAGVDADAAAAFAAAAATLI